MPRRSRRPETATRRDPLTGLFDRASFDAELAARLHRGGGAPPALAVAMLDLARFKTVNDTRGHAAGDALLAALGARFAALLRPGEFLARIGGDEFAALLPFTTAAALDDALARLRCAVDAPFSFDTFSVTCGAGVGVALVPADGLDPGTLLERADLAMYRAKRSDPATTCFFCPALDDAWRLRRDLGDHLRAAVDAGLLDLEFHPIRAVSGGDLRGFEAVPCWTHPALGRIRPETLLPLAEEAAAILPLGGWVLREACAAAATWRKRVPVSVNISPLLLADPGLIDTVAEALDDTGLPARLLCLELPEDALLHDRERALNRLHALRALGVGIVLDEFGAGPCSLDVLRAFPFDRLKLHHCALDGADETHVRRLPLLLAALPPLAALLDIPVTAQGIDTPAMFHLARRAGCDAVQGDLPDPWPPSPPVAAEHSRPGHGN